jgi:predicted alpha/beta-hydrolase family hydrolase
VTAPAATWRIVLGTGKTAGETTATWDPPTANGSGAVYVCAPGAGGHMSDRSILAIGSALRDRGIGVVRFNFLYRARGSSRPDPMPQLVECWRAVADRVRSELAPAQLILGGRSMGGRAASVAAAEGLACDRLLLLAYPLHPPGQPEKLRVAHLSAITPPVLCINGTRDTFCDRPLMERTLKTLGSNWRMHWLADADHGFHVLKRSGRTDADVTAEAADVAVEWLRGGAL